MANREEIGNELRGLTESIIENAPIETLTAFYNSVFEFERQVMKSKQTREKAYQETQDFINKTDKELGLNTPDN